MNQNAQAMEISVVGCSSIGNEFPKVWYIFFKLFVRFLLKCIKEHIIIKLIFIHRNI